MCAGMFCSATCCSGSMRIKRCVCVCVCEGGGGSLCVCERACFVVQLVAQGRCA